MKTDAFIASTQGDAAWDRLTIDERARIYDWHRAITTLPASATVAERIDKLARLPWVTSRAQARTRYYAWHTGRYAGTWRALADGNVFRRAAVKADGIHSRRFGDWGRSELDASQRSENVALDAIIAQIWAGRTAAGEPIPGLEDHPGGCLPSGCSKPNLRRILRRSKAERAAAQWEQTQNMKFSPESQLAEFLNDTKSTLLLIQDQQQTLLNAFNKLCKTLTINL